MATYQMQGGAPMQGMAMNQAALAQMAAAQSGQLPTVNSGQLQQLVAGAVVPGGMPMSAVLGAASAVPGMQGK